MNFSFIMEVKISFFWNAQKTLLLLLLLLFDCFIFSIFHFFVWWACLPSGPLLFLLEKVFFINVLVESGNFVKIINCRPSLILCSSYKFPAALVDGHKLATLPRLMTSQVVHLPYPQSQDKAGLTV